MLLPGMTATVEFLVATAADVFKIPNAALRFRPSEAIATQVRERLQKERAAAVAARQSGAGEGGAGETPGAAGMPGAPGGVRNPVAAAIDGSGAVPRHGAGSPGGPAASAAEGPGTGAPRGMGFPGGVGLQAGQGFLSGTRSAGSGRGTGSGRPRDLTLLYFLDEEGALTAMPVRTGITDGQYTEIRGRKIEAGMRIITSMTAAPQSNGSTNPFQSSPQAGSPGPPRGGF